MEEIQDLIKQISIIMIQKVYRFKGPLGFYRNIKEGYIRLEKAEEEQREFKSKINEIVIGSKKSEDQKSAKNNNETLYDSREIVTELLDNYSRIVPNTKYRTKYG